MKPIPQRRPSATLLDGLCLVIGYAVAGVVLRSWRFPSGDLGAWSLATIIYIWLGLAVSGPLVMVARRRGPSSWCGAEAAWFMIGCYCFFLLAFVPLLWPSLTAVAMVPLAAMLLINALARPRRAREPGPSWTIRAAQGLLIAWPFAWACLIFLAWRPG
jgi:hypothetical protein